MQENGAKFIKAYISQRSMSNGFIYVVDAHFIAKIERKKILDRSACGQNTLASSALDHGFEPRSGQTKDNKNGIAKH
jgi:hypothetical protein